MKRITIVGAGVYAATLCEQLAAGEANEPLEIVIAAQNEQRLSVIANACGARVAMLRPDWRVAADTNLARAVEGASLIVLLVRVGGLAARRYDETFPSLFGQVGDEGLGLGGVANTWRTLPVLASIARTIRTNAPEAKVINMLAPLATTTRLLCDAGIDAVGICELPITTEEQFGGNADLFDYAGVNHLGWFIPRGKQGERVLAAAADAGHADRRSLRGHNAFLLLPRIQSGRRTSHELRVQAGAGRPASGFDGSGPQRFSTTSGRTKFSFDKTTDPVVRPRFDTHHERPAWRT